MFSTEAPLVSLRLCRESSETLLADRSGSLYRLEGGGRLSAVSRGFHRLALLAVDDIGRHAVVVDRRSRLSLVDEKLQIIWTLQMPEAVTAVGMEPQGRFVAVALANRKNVVYDAAHRRVFHFETPRPLRFLRFLVKPGIIAAAEFGFLARTDFQGNVLWQNRLSLNIGELCCTGDGGRISLASFARGVVHLDGNGERSGSYLLEGTPNRLSGSLSPFRLAVTTTEGHLYWLDDEGELLWGAALPDAAAAVQVDAKGRGLVVGWESGRVVSLAWD